jgi:hypothetical protein
VRPGKQHGSNEEEEEEEEEGEEEEPTLTMSDLAPQCLLGKAPQSREAVAGFL